MHLVLRLWADILKSALSPPSRRGGCADLRMQRYLKKIGAAGREAQARQRAAVREVGSLLQERSDLPGRADFLR